MRPYNEFKKMMVELIEFAIDQPYFDLSIYSGMTMEETKVANKIHKCGSNACIAGYAPQVFPELFEWRSTGYPMSLKTGKTGCDVIEDFVDHYPEQSELARNINKRPLNSAKVWYLKRIFNSNKSLRKTDKQVAYARLLAIKKSRSYKQLIEMIKGNFDF